MEFVERRKFPRVPMVTKVTYILADTSQYHYSTDLSLGGMFLETRKPFKPGTRLQLEFSLPDSGRRIRLEGEVVRNVKPPPEDHDTLPGMGVEFINISSEDRAELERFIKGPG